MALRAAFDSVDVDGSGLIDESEFVKFGEKLDLGLGVAELEEELENLTLDQNGALTFATLSSWYRRIKGEEDSFVGSGESEELSEDDDDGDEYYCDGCEEKGIEKTITGDRFHKRGEEYDLCQDCYVRLGAGERQAYQQFDPDGMPVGISRARRAGIAAASAEAAEAAAYFFDTDAAATNAVSASTSAVATVDAGGNSWQSTDKPIPANAETAAALQQLQQRFMAATAEHAADLAALMADHAREVKELKRAISVAQAAGDSSSGNPRRSDAALDTIVKRALSSASHRYSRRIVRAWSGWSSQKSRQFERRAAAISKISDRCERMTKAVTVRQWARWAFKHRRRVVAGERLRERRVVITVRAATMLWKRQVFTTMESEAERRKRQQQVASSVEEEYETEIATREEGHGAAIASAAQREEDLTKLTIRIVCRTRQKTVIRAVLGALRATVVFERRTQNMIALALERRAVRTRFLCFGQWKKHRREAEIVRRVVTRMGDLSCARAFDTWHQAVQMRNLLDRVARRLGGRTIGSSFAKWLEVWHNGSLERERIAKEEQHARRVGEKQAALGSALQREEALQQRLQGTVTRHEQEVSQMTAAAAQERDSMIKGFDAAVAKLKADHTGKSDAAAKRHASAMEASEIAAATTLERALAAQAEESAAALVAAKAAGAQALEEANAKHAEQQASLVKQHSDAVVQMQEEYKAQEQCTAAEVAGREATEDALTVALASGAATERRGLGLLEGWVERWRVGRLAGATWRRWCIGVWMQRYESSVATTAEVEDARSNLNTELHTVRVNLQFAMRLGAAETARLMQAAGQQSMTPESVAERWEDMAELTLGCPGTTKSREAFAVWRAGACAGRRMRRRERRNLSYGGRNFDADDSDSSIDVSVSGSEQHVSAGWASGGYWLVPSASSEEDDEEIGEFEMSRRRKLKPQNSSLQQRQAAAIDAYDSYDDFETSTAEDDLIEQKGQEELEQAREQEEDQRATEHKQEMFRTIAVLLQTEKLNLRTTVRCFRCWKQAPISRKCRDTMGDFIRSSRQHRETSEAWIQWKAVFCTRVDQQLAATDSPWRRPSPVDPLRPIQNSNNHRSNSIVSSMSVASVTSRPLITRRRSSSDNPFRPPPLSPTTSVASAALSQLDTRLNSSTGAYRREALREVRRQSTLRAAKEVAAQSHASGQALLKALSNSARRQRMWSSVRHSFGRWVSFWRWWRATAEMDEAEKETLLESESEMVLLKEQHKSALLKQKLEGSQREMRVHKLIFDRAQRVRKHEAAPRLRAVMHSWLVLSFRQRTLRAEDTASIAQADALIPFRNVMLECKAERRDLRSVASAFESWSQIAAQRKRRRWALFIGWRQREQRWGFCMLLRAVLKWHERTKTRQNERELDAVLVSCSLPPQESFSTLGLACAAWVLLQYISIKISAWCAG